MALSQPLSRIIEQLTGRLKALKARQDDERHGLLLCLSSRVDNIRSDEVLSLISILTILEMVKTARYRREDLVAEALSSLITASSKNLAPDDAVKLANIPEMLLNKWLRRNEVEVVDAASEASYQIFRTLHISSPPAGNALLFSWIGFLAEPQGGEIFCSTNYYKHG